MARYPGLVRRQARWYLRSRVPADLTDFIKRAEVWRSLGTVEYREAIRRYTSARLTLQRWFDQQRQRRDAGERLNGAAPVMVANWFYAQEQRAAPLDFGLCGDDLTDALGETEVVLADLLAGEGGAEVETAVDQVLLANGWPGRPHVIGSIQTRKTKIADAPDEHRAALSELIRRALVEAGRRRRDRLQGLPARPVDQLFNGAVVQPGANDTGQGALLSQVAERWIDECGPSWAKSTEIEFRAAARMLQEALGDVPMDRIDRPALREFKGLLLRAPFRSHPRYGRMPLPRAVEASANDLTVRRLAPPSVNKYLGAVHMLMQWACDNGYRQDNPATKLKVPLGRRPDKEGRPFTAAELKTLFGPAYARLRGHERWLPLLAVYTGARLGELAQLQVTDVRRVHGVRVIAIAPGARKKLKSRSAERVIPVHPALERAGFLRYAAAIRRANPQGGQLFPELRPRGKRESLSQAFSKTFGRYRRALGITDAEVRIGMHSFRHTFADALRAAGVEPELRNTLMGHAQGHVGARYGERLDRLCARHTRRQVDLPRHAGGGSPGRRSVGAMSNQAEAIQAIAAALAAVMLPDGAAVLDPAALAAALADWHERRDGLAQSDDWCAGWPDNLDLRNAVLDLLLVYEDEIVYRRNGAQAEAAGDHADAQAWQDALARCAELRRALAERIASLI